MKNFALAMSLLTAACAFAQCVSAPKSTAPLPAAYQKWVDEDVSYIATPEEKKALVTLKDDAERDEFVRQFWLRRDPTPGTDENEFKEEHYRRLAYANVHFASKLPGWKTDRGYFYIVQGPPDEIASVKSSTGIPREVWTYRKSRSTVVFEDRCGCREYELVK